MDQVKVDIIPAQSLEGIIKALLIGFESQFGIGPDFGDDDDGIFLRAQGFAQPATVPVTSLVTMPSHVGMKETG